MLNFIVLTYCEYFRKNVLCTEKGIIIITIIIITHIFGFKDHCYNNATKINFEKVFGNKKNHKE